MSLNLKNEQVTEIIKNPKAKIEYSSCLGNIFVLCGYRNEKDLVVILEVFTELEKSHLEKKILFQFCHLGNVCPLWLLANKWQTQDPNTTYLHLFLENSLCNSTVLNSCIHCIIGLLFLNLRALRGSQGLSFLSCFHVENVFIFTQDAKWDKI